MPEKLKNKTLWKAQDNQQEAKLRERMEQLWKKK
jgi:putative ATPase